MNEEFEKLYEVMYGRIHAVVNQYGGLLKMDKEDLEQELMILLFQLIEKHGYEEMMNRGPYFYGACVNTVYNLSLKEHKQGLFLECSNIEVGNDEFDIWDTYVDDGIDYEMKDEYLERYYEEKRQRAREYYRNNRDKRLEWQKAYDEAHKEEIAARKRAYYHAHIEEERARCRKYYEAHREKKKEYHKQYYEANKEEIAERKRKYREAHREEIAEKRRKYYEAHREEIKEYRRIHRQKKKQQKLEAA